MSQRISRSSFGGACVLSSLGSLPLHVMPILIAAAMQAGKVTLAQAGLIASMYSIGQLAVAIALPIFMVQSISLSASILVCVLLVLVILFHVHAGLVIFLAAWMVIGACAGVLNYLGVTAAAAAEDKSNSFTTRLGVTLFVAGATMLVFYACGAFSGFTYTVTYTHAIFIVGMATTVLAVGGMIFYRKPLPIKRPDSIPKLKNVSDKNDGWVGLTFIFFFIAAQIGFIVFAVDAATHRGIDVIEATAAIAICKIIAAVVLLVFANDSRLIPNPVTGNLLLPVIALAAGIFLISNTTSVGFFLLGFLLWESSVNLLSAGFQAGVVMLSPYTGGMFLSCVILAGAAIGPVLHSLAAGFHVQYLFYSFVLLSVFLPLVWNRQLVTERIKLEQL